jgi:galactokinase
MTYHTPKTPPPIHLPTSEAERLEILVTHLARNYRVAPEAIRAIRAPLRISPLGAHIDHQLGHVTGLTINRALLLAFAPADDGSVTIESLNFQPSVSFNLANVPPPLPGDWGNYIRGAVLALQRQYHLQHGLVGVISGEMPIGGLSSSAAVTLTYLLALQTVNKLSVPLAENVALVRFTENQYIGLNNGILDQTTILFSRPNRLTYIDCRNFGVDQIATSLQPADYDILIVYSGVSRVLAGTSYNNRVAECQAAARLLLGYGGQEAGPDVRLGHVDPAIFDAEGHRLPATLKRRATHYFGEYRRVSAGLEAWQAGDLRRTGALINESGESSIIYYESGSPQLITLYQILSQTPGVYGSRFSGGGFGGCCLALIDPAARESIAEAVHRQYPAAHPAEAANYSLHFCRPDGPARLL